MTAGAKQMIMGPGQRERAGQGRGPEPDARSLPLSSRRVGLASFMVVKPYESGRTSFKFR